MPLSFRVMRADDPCASASSLTLADSADRTLTIGPPTPQPVAMNRLHAHLREAGDPDTQRAHMLAVDYECQGA